VPGWCVAIGRPTMGRLLRPYVGRTGEHRKRWREMTDETTETTETAETPAGSRWASRKTRRSQSGAPQSSGGAVYGLGMIGALVYFAGTAESGRDYALALGKAMVWPALLVFRAFKALEG
jgi:hypothetical protein